jgi:hypothetical protein
LLATLRLDDQFAFGLRDPELVGRFTLGVQTDEPARASAVVVGQGQH